MKVLLIANTYWNIVNFRQPIIDLLEKKGAEVYISAPFSVAVFRKKQNTPHFIEFKYTNSHQNGFLNVCQSIQEFKRLFLEIKPDLVLLYTMKPNIFGNIAAAQLNIPVISTVTGLGYTFIKGGWTRFLSERLYKFAFRKTKHIIFHNPDDRQLFVNQGFVKQSQCSVIRGSGVDFEKFKPRPKSKKKDKFIFIFIGRLLIDKGIREYLAAAKSLVNLRHVEFHVVGELYPDNPATLTKQEWFSSLRKAKNIIWHQNQEDVRSFLAAADVMVLPSYREGLPMSILEAMAMGKPIITTDVPGCRETVDEKINGLLVPVKDSRVLANAMLVMYDLPEAKRMLWGRRSREKAIEDFSSKVVVTAYKKLIDNFE
ncbi:MAG: glycosyltransferase involved in cell wall biosynthesis [Saprospiraceae bacterium]|jgi:glycosyltransferase involved in cell wall biosynthesis